MDVIEPNRVELEFEQSYKICVQIRLELKIEHSSRAGLLDKFGSTTAQGRLLNFLMCYQSEVQT